MNTERKGLSSGTKDQFGILNIFKSKRLILATLIICFLLFLVKTDFLSIRIGNFYINGKIACTPSDEDIDSTALIGNAQCPSPEAIERRRVKSFLHSSEIIWERSVEARHNRIGSRDLKKINAWDTKTHVILWDYFYSTFNCPHHMERIGKMGDGGKWVCGFNLYERKPRPKCIVYSFGVSSESSYEEEIFQRSDCEIFAYDFSVTKMGPQMTDPQSPRIHFKPLGVSNEDKGKFRTLGSLMKENGHGWIDILKIDVEGAEYKVLDQISEEFDILPFGQMQLEIHFSVTVFANFYTWWERLEAKGLRPFMNEVNHYPQVGGQKLPLWMEFSFLNIKGNHTLLH